MEYWLTDDDINVDGVSNTDVGGVDDDDDDELVLILMVMIMILTNDYDDADE